MDYHYERNLVVNNRVLTYKGIFRVDELFAAINKLLEEKGYTKREKKTEETVTQAGRRTHVELRPFKDKTEFVRLGIKIKVTLDDITQTFEEHKGQTRKFEKGNVTVAFDAWILSDYEDRWGMKPLVYFLKAVINKYIYQFPLESGFSGEVAEDTAFLYGNIKKLLSSYKHQSSKTVVEEDVIKSVAKDVEKVQKHEEEEKVKEEMGDEEQ